ncbi:MAG: GNAT family N-acetyltransferase [Chloroflexota bacterium]|nr:GNAT family N-acetyltransferase [Chloroflexota bacterium]MDE3194412.1 GNAT family N-acetyltransferase [Chloroflexota bacterium]
MADVTVRPLSELDLDGITRIDERITGRYRPEVWEERVTYYIRRDAEASQVAESGGKVVGFMLGEVRGGEFGLEEATGWLDFMGVDPDARGKGVGGRLADALLAHFRSAGVHVARTMVRTEDEQILGFVRSIGFAPAPISSLEKRL